MVNFNVLLATADMRLARGIARGVSARGGGLPGVEAMALPHQQGAAGMQKLNILQLLLLHAASHNLMLITAVVCAVTLLGCVVQASRWLATC